MNAFDFINILNKKTKLPENLDGYTQYLVNKSLSMAKHTTKFANEINLLKDISDSMHFTLIYNILPKQNGYNKWIKSKKDTDEDILVLVEHYSISKQKAKEYLKLLSPKDLDKIKEQLFYGGTDDNPVKPAKKIKE